jgi:hypothetical protein
LQQGPSIKYVSTFWVIFDPSLPHVSNPQHFNTPSLKSMSAFAKFIPPPPPPSSLKFTFIRKFLKAQIKISLKKPPPQKKSSYFVYRFNFEQTKWLEKTMRDLQNLLTSSNVSIWQPPPPLKSADVLYGWSHR